MPPTFKEINRNPSECSAWLKEKGRCCQRKISAADQTRKTSLRRSIDAHQVFNGDEANELADLHFCKRWHRDGGNYAIPGPEKRKILQLLFPSEGRPWSAEARSPHLEQQHTVASSRALFETPVRDSIPASDNVPIPVQTRRTRLSARTREPESSPGGTISTPRRSARILGQEPGLSPAVSIPTPRRSARIRGQEPAISPPVSIPIPRPGPRTQGQEAGTLPELPIRRSARIQGHEPDTSPGSSSPTPRWARPVDLDDVCPVCHDALRDPEGVSRCNACQNDLHTCCLLEWLTSPNSARACVNW